MAGKKIVIQQYARHADVPGGWRHPVNRTVLQPRLGERYFQGLAALLKSKFDVGSGGEINASLFFRQSLTNVILQCECIGQLGGNTDLNGVIYFSPAKLPAICQRNIIDGNRNEIASRRNRYLIFKK